MADESSAIYTLTNADGGNVYPQTVADAVKFDDNTTVKAKIQQLEDMINELKNKTN